MVQRIDISLNNALEIVPKVINDVRFAVNEHCIQYNWCDSYTSFWFLPTRKCMN